MRIAYLTGEYPRVTDTFIQREVAELRRLGATVQPFSVRRPRDGQALSQAQKEERDRTFYLLPFSPLALLSAHLKSARRLGRYLSALALAWRTRQRGVRGTLYQLAYFLEAGLLAERLRKEKIMHLHNHIGDSSGTVTMLASALGGFGYSFTLHGPGIFFEPYRWRIDQKILRAKFVCCISQFCRSQAMIFAPMEAWSKLKIVRCGVDPQLFERSSKRGFEQSSEMLAGPAALSMSRLAVGVNSGQDLLFVGRLAAAKGLPVLLESLAQLRVSHPTIHLTVVGDGPDRSRLEQQVDALEIGRHVDFVGYKSPAAVRRYLRNADVFVMSSFAEGVPVVLMEAMVARLPVVATRIAGISELVEEGKSGFLVPPGDVGTLSDRISRLLANERLRDRFGIRGEQWVREAFNSRTEARKLYALIAEAVGEVSERGRTARTAERRLNLAAARR